MYHSEEKNSKIFSPEGPRENVWGPSENVSRAPLWLSTGLTVTSTFYLPFLIHC